jgi:hypothetical protein
MTRIKIGPECGHHHRRIWNWLIGSRSGSFPLVDIIELEHVTDTTLDPSAELSPDFATGCCKGCLYPPMHQNLENR